MANGEWSQDKNTTRNHKTRAAGMLSLVFTPVLSPSAIRHSPSFTADPAAVHRVVQADELEKRRPALRVFVECALDCRDNFPGLGHVLGVVADGARHRG